MSFNTLNVLKLEVDNKTLFLMLDWQGKKIILFKTIPLPMKKLKLTFTKIKMIFLNTTISSDGI